VYISRISHDAREQLTIDHLRESAAYASLLGSKFNAPALARLAALFHDMGKYSQEFVHYLRSSTSGKAPGGHKPRRGSVIHATQGAKYIYEAAVNNKSGLLAAEIAAICAAGHHGGLLDAITPQGNTPLRDKLSASKDGLNYEEVVSAFAAEGVLSESVQELLLQCDEELRHFISACRSKNLNTPFMLNLLVKSIFSCLVDSDRYSAHSFERGEAPGRTLAIPPWGDYAQRLEAYVAAFSDASPIDRIRSDISAKCLAAAKRPRGVYRLHVPTGGGKTLSSLRFALNHAARHSMEHVIYIIPYLSVLEQTADEIRKALQCDAREDFILEHHSNRVPPDDESEAQAYRLLTERWSQPVIITTLVQFLESVYSHRAGDLRKLHNMANAVFVFDEVQSLPIKCVHLFNEAVNYLHHIGGSSVLLCTATQPLIDKVRKPVCLSSPSELIDDTADAFSALKRTRIVPSIRHGGYTMEALRDFVLEKLNMSGNCLVILNTKRDAARLYHAIQAVTSGKTGEQLQLVHLSTSMCPAHRLDALASMQESVHGKKRLKEGRILCISTQLIEAGVDISFACVVRALAGLDSIMQAAGRCNRHGEAPEGREVFVVNVADESLSKLPDIQLGRGVAWRIFDERGDDLQASSVMDRYYAEYFFKQADRMDYPIKAGTIYDLLECNTKGLGAHRNYGGKPPFPALRQAFQTAGEQFCVIEQGTTSVLVPYERGASLADEYKRAKLRDKPRLLREMGRHSVSLYPYQIKQLDELGALSIVDGDIYVLHSGFYDATGLGVHFKGNLEFLNA
jgi:CRISPR-associated endonuclease/helicase Cas3